MVAFAKKEARSLMAQKESCRLSSESVKHVLHVCVLGFFWLETLALAWCVYADCVYAEHVLGSWLCMYFDVVVKRAYISRR
jgi:hypothetical protein